MPATQKLQAIGSYRDNVRLFGLPSSELDAYGQPQQVGAEIGTFRAVIIPMHGRQVQQLSAVMPMAYYEVYMRFEESMVPASPQNPGGRILPGMYLVLDDGRRLDVVFAADVEELHQQWKLTCVEKVSI